MIKIKKEHYYGADIGEYSYGGRIKKSMEQIRQELVTSGNCALTESKVYFWRAFPVTYKK